MLSSLQKQDLFPWGPGAFLFCRKNTQMAKRRSEVETTASDVTAATYSTVFIDTSLDTHLAMIVSYSDTVSDLKRKVMFEHLQCFPKLGEIKIHSLKVKRKGNFYHLSDSMLVSSAFEAGKRNWFVSIDASSLKQQNNHQNSCRSEASNPLALVCFQQNLSGESSLQRLVSTQCTNQKLPDAEHSSPKELKDVDIEVKDIASDDVADKRSDIKVQEKYEVISDQCNNSMEQFLETKRAVKNKRKIKKQNDDSVRDRSLKDQFASNQMSIPEIVGPTNTLVGAGREVLNDVEMGSKDVVNEEDSLSRPAGKKKREIESTECSGNPSEIGAGEKKIKRRRKNAKCEPLVQHAEEERSFNENVEINHEFGNEKQSELVQEVVERNNVTSPSLGTDMCEVDAFNAKGNSDAPELTAGLNESSKRKKKRVKKVAKMNQDLPGMEQANDVVGDTALPVVRWGIDDHFNDEINKHKSILSHPESKEVSEQKPIDDSSTGAGREVDNMIESEAQRLPQGNTDLKNKEPIVSAKLLEAEGAVDSVKVGGTKKKEKKVKKSAAGSHDVSNLLTGGISEMAPNLAINGHSSDLMDKDESFLSRIEREEASSQQKLIDSSLVVSDRELDNMSGNEMDSPPLTQVDRSKENADDVDEKSGKKLKKGRISTTLKPSSDFLSKEQEHIVESVPLNEVEKNQDTVNMDSRLKTKTKKKQKSTAKSRSDLPINELGVDELTASDNKLRDRDPQSKTAEEPKPEAKTDKHEQMEASNEGDEINFKHYFVPGREEKESAPVDKLKEATRPDRDMKSKKNKKKPVVSSIGTSPELQNKEKSKDEDSDLMPPHKKSLEVSGSAVKTRTDASFNGIHKHQTGVDTYNAAVRKGSAKNTGEVEEIRKASSEAKNGSQQEKSLLATPCAIFSDDSSDSSADEKRSVDSDASTRTPSHNSSSSGSSMDSPTNGSYGTERKEGGKNITKSHRSAGPKNITMDMIFRSSSRFKKAKLTALGDSESQPVDFVPDSQANV